MSYWRRHFEPEQRREARRRWATKYPPVEWETTGVRLHWRRTLTKAFEDGRGGWLSAVETAAVAGEGLLARRWWAVPEALVWICLRDAGRVAATLAVEPQTTWTRLAPRINLYQQYEPERDLKGFGLGVAEEKLLAALKAESVISNGTPFGCSATASRAIQSFEWERSRGFGARICEAVGQFGDTMYVDVLISSAEVREIWPKVDGHPAGSGQTVSVDGLPAGGMETGLPGRPPKIRPLLISEFERRVTAGLMASSCAAEARELIEWWKAARPGEVVPSPLTLENAIRDQFRRARANPTSTK